MNFCSEVFNFYAYRYTYIYVYTCMHKSYYVYISNMSNISICLSFYLLIYKNYFFQFIYLVKHPSIYLIIYLFNYLFIRLFNLI